MQTIQLSKDLISQQKLLFGEFKPIKLENPSDDINHQKYYQNGYVVLSKVSDYQDAETKMRTFISTLNTTKVPLIKDYTGSIELAKIDGIPMCEDSIEAGCQALHFDLAQPFVAESGHSTYLVIGLYRPLNGKPTDAKTRIVFLPKLANKSPKLSKELVKKRLDKYVQKHGDGWIDTTQINTNRLALFARFIDAIYNKNKLMHYRNSTMAQWFSKETDPGILAEHDFFKECGIDLTKAEERITLQPGELLILDNIRCVHGRVGSRDPEEIFQFMYGVKEAKPEAISKMVNWMVGLFSKA